MRLVLPLPPSANRYWRNVNGRTLLSKEARAYRERCAFVAAFQWKGAPFAGRVRVHADVFMSLRGDLDNRAKQILDALQGTAFADDASVWDLRLVRHLDRTNPRVEVVVEEIAA